MVLFRLLEEIVPYSLIREIKRDNYCFDSVEHGLGGVIELWECHKQGRNQVLSDRHLYLTIHIC